jgi:hypothetical protein
MHFINSVLVVLSVAVTLTATPMPEATIPGTPTTICGSLTLNCKPTGLCKNKQWFTKWFVQVINPEAKRAAANIPENTDTWSCARCYQSAPPISSFGTCSWMVRKAPLAPVGPPNEFNLILVDPTKNTIYGIANRPT